MLCPSDETEACFHQLSIHSGPLSGSSWRLRVMMAGDPFGVGFCVHNKWNRRKESGLVPIPTLFGVSLNGILSNASYNTRSTHDSPLSEPSNRSLCIVSSFKQRWLYRWTLASPNKPKAIYALHMMAHYGPSCIGAIRYISDWVCNRNSDVPDGWKYTFSVNVQR